MHEYRYHPMTEAARNNDAIAEEHGFEKTIQHLGLNLKAVMHVASQRAMRLTILTSRGEAALKALNTGRPQPVRLTPAEEAISERFTLALLDGLLIGWRAREIEDGNDKEAERENQ